MRFRDSPPGQATTLRASGPCSVAPGRGRHELKGGAWTSPFLRATPSSFNDAAASMCDDDTGFRCVVTAETLDH